MSSDLQNAKRKCPSLPRLDIQTCRVEHFSHHRNGPPSRIKGQRGARRAGLVATTRPNLAPLWRRGGQTPILCSKALMEGGVGEGGASEGGTTGVADGDAERRMRLVYREGGFDDLEGLTELSLEAFTGCCLSPHLSLISLPPFLPSSLCLFFPFFSFLFFSIFLCHFLSLPLSLSPSLPLYLSPSLPLSLHPLPPYLKPLHRLSPTHSLSHQCAEEFGAIEKIMSLFSGDIPQRRSEVSLSTVIIRDDPKSFPLLVSAASGRSHPLHTGQAAAPIPFILGKRPLPSPSSWVLKISPLPKPLTLNP